MMFNDWKDAEEKYYETHVCNSDDSDLEGAQVEKWVEQNGHGIISDGIPERDMYDERLDGHTITLHTPQHE